MDKQFVPYALSLKLKELGFDEKCFGGYNQSGDLHMGYNASQKDVKQNFDGCLAPLWQQAFDWFLKHYSLDIRPKRARDKSSFKIIKLFKYTEETIFISNLIDNNIFKEEVLIRLINHVNEQITKRG